LLFLIQNMIKYKNRDEIAATRCRGVIEMGMLKANLKLREVLLRYISNHGATIKKLLLDSCNASLRTLIEEDTFLLDDLVTKGFSLRYFRNDESSADDMIRCGCLTFREYIDFYVELQKAWKELVEIKVEWYLSFEQKDKCDPGEGNLVVIEFMAI
jgi:hypothetical protein